MAEQLQHPETITVMGVDPGLLTGVAVVKYSLPRGAEVIASAELMFDQLMNWCDAWMETVDRLVVERFIITKKTVSNSQAPWSLEGIGVTRAMAIQHELNMEMQSAAEGKSAVDNQMLRRLELWHRGGQGHANDAIRHTVAYMLRRGWRDPRILPEG